MEIYATKNFSVPLWYFIYEEALWSTLVPAAGQPAVRDRTNKGDEISTINGSPVKLGQQYKGAPHRHILVSEWVTMATGACTLGRTAIKIRNEIESRHLRREMLLQTDSGL